MKKIKYKKDQKCSNKNKINNNNKKINKINKNNDKIYKYSIESMIIISKS
jgi:hypothetical protein